VKAEFPRAVKKTQNKLRFVQCGPSMAIATIINNGNGMNRYLIVIEVTETGFSAYSPDLPGCVSTGATRQEVEANTKEAIEFHLDGMKQERFPIPEATSDSMYVEIAS
jgi:predicted RNase H-like HicB family nuclease